MCGVPMKKCFIVPKYVALELEGDAYVIDGSWSVYGRKFVPENE